MANKKPIKVLLVDDDEDDYILTKAIFNDIPQSERYELSWINNYEEGINAMLKSHYDIYLVDYRLGKSTGLDLLREAIKSNVDEPIIILTGKGDSRVDEEALETGAADYLLKYQINPHNIERSLRYAIKNRLVLKALRESENKFRIIYERSKEAFLIMNSAGVIKDVNSAALQFFRYAKNEILALSSTQLYHDATDSLRFEELMDEKGAISDFETDFITKHGDIKKASVSAFSQIDQHATEELYHCIIHDITIRKKEERASVDAEKIAVTERIAKSLANEIRNPLYNINLSLEQLILELKAEDETSRLYLDIISNNFERINHLITDFINSTQSLELNIQPRALSSLIDKSIDRVSREITKEVIIQKEYDQADLMVDVDDERIIKTIYNILYNAIDATANKIIIKVFQVNDHGIIEIADDGDGVTAENQSRVFEPFFTTRHKKMGLGLTIAQKNIINHKGSIEFESSEGEGTKFIIRLPLTSQTYLWNS